MQKTLLFLTIISTTLFVSGCFTLNTDRSMPMPGVIPQEIVTTTNQTQYETKDLIIPTPAPLILRDDGEKVTLYHTVEAFSHSDFCDFKGDSLSTTTFHDFTVSFSFSTLSLKDSVLKFGGDYLKENFNTDGSIVEQPGFFSKITIGKFSGYQLSQGIEGCGYDYYFLPTEKGVLVIQKNTVPELTDLNPQKENFAEIKNVILPEQAEQLFEEAVKNVVIK